MGKSHSVEKSLTKPSKLALSRSHSTLATLFRGLLFALSRVAPPTGTVDFDSKEQESIIRKHGGQILSLKLMDAMKTDSKSSSQRRKCYVVCWGGAPRLELNPILSQLKRNDICDLILVTPIWLKTCISIQKLIPPSRMLEVFAPRALPWKSMEAMDLRVSLSGFTAMEKMALMTLMKICGVCFMNEMTTKCTHLICKQNTPGLKLQKAMEWGLHIVSINWLFYILQYGYSGDDSSREGCENRFALILNDSVADQP